MQQATSTQTKNLVNWIQLNADDPETRLVAVKFPSGTKRLVLVANQDLTNGQLQVLGELGFYRSRSGFLVRDDLRFSLQQIQRAFPKAHPVKVPMNWVTRIMPERPASPASVTATTTTPKVSSPAVSITPQDPTQGREQPAGNESEDRPDEVLPVTVTVNNAVMSARPLGMNYRGQMVFLGEDGRFIQGPAQQIIREADSRGATFLYGATAEDLALCADGLVREIAGGKVLRFDDLKRFSSIVTEIPEGAVLSSPRAREVQEAIEAALVRHIRKQPGMTPKAAYSLAIKLHEGQPPLTARTSESVALQQYSTPLPLSVAVQQVLGSFKGRSVLEPTIGNGSLVCTVKDAAVAGVELDVRRLDAIRRDRSEANIQHGDATSFDFRSLNGGGAFDVVLSNPPFGGLQPPRMMSGLKVSRVDHLIMIRSLQARADDGVGVYIIGADSYLDSQAGLVTGGSRYLFNWLADHYQVDAVEVDGGIYTKQGASFPIRIVVVGKKEAGHAQVPDRLPVLLDHDEVFEWAAGMYEKYGLAEIRTPEVGFQEALSDSAVVELDGDAPMEDRSTELPHPTAETESSAARAVAPVDRSEDEENSYQSPYAAFSRAGEATAMVPRNLATPTRMALTEVVREEGDVDGFVAAELGWSVEELGGYLSPEQVDAVALAINTLQKGRGFLEADQTGLGKGRVMAALARYSVLQQKTVVFLTETPTLFTDFWRDISDIGSAELFTPMIVNDGVSIFDPISGNKLVPATPKAVIQAALDGGVVDPAYNLVLGTYSQFNRDRAKSSKARWISQIAEGKALLLDEAHNAAGESNTGQNIGLAIDNADFVVYSSATAMKAGKNVMLYSELFPETVDMGALPETLAIGGEVLQEVLSGMLARDGVFIRREHDLSNLAFSTVSDDEREERNRSLSDKLAEILELMNYLAGDINELVNKRNKEIKKALEAIPEVERKGNRMGAVSTNFGSRLYAIYRQFMMAIKTDLAADRAIKALEEGKKPVIVLESTMESLLVDIVADLRPGFDEADAEEFGASLQGETELDGYLTFRDVLHRMLHRLTYYVETNRYGEATKVPVTSEEFMDVVSTVDGLINDFPDLPVSPLDENRTRIATAGFICDELSGRKLQIHQRAGSFFASPVLERPKAQIVKDFVTGTTDALLLTRAGSTGISLHAGEKFPDQRRRVMIELQSAADVNVRVQFFGRVNRKGQTSSPEIETLSSGLIGEARPIAMQNSKLRKLSANTTANQDNAALDRSVPDFINAIGDEVAFRYLEANPRIAQRLDINLENEDEREESYFINKLTSRLVMLRVVEQEQIYEALTNEYLRVIKELDAKGVNPLKSRELDVRAREVGRVVYESGNPHSDSAFNQPVFAKTIEYDVALDPMRSDAVKRLVREGTAAVEHFRINHERRQNQDFFLALKGFLAVNRRKFLETVLAKDFKSVDEALAAKRPNSVQKMMHRLKVLDGVLDGLQVGAVARFTNNDGETDFGVIASIAVPDNPKHIHLLGGYELSFAVPGRQTLIDRTLYSLQDDVQFRIMPKAGLLDDLMLRFDTAPAGNVTYQRLILDGNLFKAAQIAAAGSIGSSIIYTDERGARHRGVLMARGVDLKHLQSLPVRVETAAMCGEVLDRFPAVRLTTSPGLSDDDESEMRLFLQDGMAVMEVPGSKVWGGRYFGNEDLIKVTGPFAGTRKVMVAKFPTENISKAMGILYRQGVSLYAESSLRQAINNLSGVIYSNESENEERMRAVKA